VIKETAEARLAVISYWLEEASPERLLEVIP
jgi:hypothetical protein